MATENPSPDHCLKDKCLVKTKKKNSNEMIRCIICCVWHHAGCVSVAKEDTAQIWSCFQCRVLPENVKELKKEIVQMHTQQTEMMDLIRGMHKQLQSETEEKKKIASELESLRNNLKDNLIDFLQNKRKDTNSDPTNVVPQPQIPEAPPLVSLLIGTSLLRNVDPDKLQNYEVIAEGGASIQDLQTALCKLPDDKRYKDITIIGGSIDVENKSVDDVISDYQALLVSTSKKTDKSLVCSILPRADKDLTDKMKKTNADLKNMCENDGYTFFDMDQTFLLQNGNTNKSFLLKDGLHLTKDGLDSLIKECDIKLREGCDSAYIEQKYKKVKGQVTEKMLFKGHESPLSNFYPVKGLIMDNTHFATSEAAYVYFKAQHHHDRKTAESVKRSKTGIHAKRLGDRILTNSAWQQKKIDVMDNIVRAKLAVCPEARKTLKESGSKELVEDTTHAFWGRGKSGDGLNMLGQIWMMYRSRTDSIIHARRDTPQRTWATRSHQPKCYRCGEAGHLIEQCHQRSDMTCYNCGSYGHKRKNCRRSASHRMNYFNSY